VDDTKLALPTTTARTLASCCWRSRYDFALDIQALHRRKEEALAIVYLKRLPHLKPLDQDLEIAVGHFDALKNFASSCCVAKNISLLFAFAYSSARTLDSRPTTNGVVMPGTTTMSRTGIIDSL
jgi:hypothetical protein